MISLEMQLYRWCADALWFVCSRDLEDSWDFGRLEGLRFGIGTLAARYPELHDLETLARSTYEANWEKRCKNMTDSE